MRRDAKESLITITMPWHIFLSSDLLNHPLRLLGVVGFLRRHSTGGMRTIGACLGLQYLFWENWKIRKDSSFGSRFRETGLASHLSSQPAHARCHVLALDDTGFLLVCRRKGQLHRW